MIFSVIKSNFQSCFFLSPQTFSFLATGHFQSQQSLNFKVVFRFYGDDDHGDCSVQSVPGTGDKEDKEDKGMTIEEKKEAERQR